MLVLATLFSLGFFSGLNVYAVVFVSGLAIRFGWLKLIPALESLEVLSHPAILIVSGAMYALEFFADKIPWVDNIWDGVHTMVRPLAAVFLALHVLGDQDPELQNHSRGDLWNSGINLTYSKSRYSIINEYRFTSRAV